MGQNKKPRKKYSNNHAKTSRLFELSKPTLISMIHTADGRRKLWSITEQELKEHPENSEYVHTLRQNLIKYDQLQGVSQDYQPPTN